MWAYFSCISMFTNAQVSEIRGYFFRIADEFFMVLLSHPPRPPLWICQCSEMYCGGEQVCSGEQQLMSGVSVCQRWT